MYGRRGSRGRNFGRDYYGGRSFRNQSMDRSGPPRLDFKNPTSDQVTKYLSKMKDYLEGEGNVIKTVFTRIEIVEREDPDDEGKFEEEEIEHVEKMSLIFGSESSPGRYPIAEKPEPVRYANTDSAAVKDMKMKEWDIESKEYKINVRGISLEKSSIAGILKSTINFNVKEIMKKSEEGRNALNDELGKPMEIINVLKTTDFSSNAASTQSDFDKYFNAYTKFNSADFKQNYDESLNTWGKRFNNELNSLKLLATKCGKEQEIPSDITLANTFLKSLNGLYNKLRDDLEKGIRTPKPDSVESVINMAIVYDRPAKDKEYERDYRGAYAVSARGRGRGRSISNVIPGDWKCKIHGTDTHEYWDEICQKQCAEKSKREEAMIGNAIDGRRQYFANHSGRFNGGRGRGRFRGRGRYRG